MPGASQTDEAVPATKLSRRTVLIIAAIAVLVLAGVGTTVYFLTRGDDEPVNQGGASGPGAVAQDATPGGSTPAAAPAAPPGPATGEAGTARQVAEQAIQAFNARDAQAMKKISCDPEALLDNLPPEARVELAANPELTGDTGSVELKLIIGDQSTTTPLPLRKHNGTWCVD